MDVICGIDVGGTKIAAGIVDPVRGGVKGRLEVPTRPERGGQAILDDCVAMAAELAADTVGIGLCELVDIDRKIVSAATIDWRELDVEAAFGDRVVIVESDVRCAAHAESSFGRAWRETNFLYVSAGTGIAGCLVRNGEPWLGAHGHAIVIGAPPVELVASGLAIEQGADFGEAADALGRELAGLVNFLDPAAIVLGGGLGLNRDYRNRAARAMRPLIYSDAARDVPLHPGMRGANAGIVGAALSALQ